MTFLCLSDEHGAESAAVRWFVSNEYLPWKERDAEGKVLPNQEWQHPDPSTLRYTEVQGEGAPNVFPNLIEIIEKNDRKAPNSHIRVIHEGALEISAGRLQSWKEKIAEDEAWRDAEQRREMDIENEKRAPVYEYCSRCDGEREACKNPKHRGNRKCMTCCGGVGNRDLRHCMNCLDLPYRELREKALGAPIVYAGEE